MRSGPHAKETAEAIPFRTPHHTCHFNGNRLGRPALVEPVDHDSRMAHHLPSGPMKSVVLCPRLAFDLLPPRRYSK